MQAVAIDIISSHQHELSIDAGHNTKAGIDLFFLEQLHKAVSSYVSRTTQEWQHHTSPERHRKRGWYGGRTPSTSHDALAASEESYFVTLPSNLQSNAVGRQLTSSQDQDLCSTSGPYQTSEADQQLPCGAAAAYIGFGRITPDLALSFGDWDAFADIIGLPDV